MESNGPRVSIASTSEHEVKDYERVQEGREHSRICGDTKLDKAIRREGIP